MKYSQCQFFRLVFRQLAVAWVCACMILPTPVLLAQSAPIVTDGRTDTSLHINGAVTDVHTNTIRGTTGYNSFERFNVPSGNTTNLYVPSGANSLVNLVHNERSQIDGILNSFKNGQTGGDIFFLNPHGIVIGQNGMVNVGSLHLQTPTQDYMKQLINEHGQISAVHEQMLFDGKVPISPTGLISVKGTINAVEEINLTAGEIDLARASRLRAGHQVQVEFGNLVNIDGIDSGNELVETPDGKIRIVAAGGVTAAGKVSVDAVSGTHAGQIEILAGNNINVNDGAEITARGVGANSNGGDIELSAGSNLLLTGALIDSSAANGKAGDVVLSAIDSNWSGMFSPGAVKKNTITIDATSLIRGNDISIKAIASQAGFYIDTLEDGTVVDKNGDPVDDDDLARYYQYADSLFDTFAGGTMDLLTGQLVPFDGYDVTASVQIDGTLEAKGSIDIVSKAEAVSEIRTFGIGGIIIPSVSVTLTDSIITIGGTAKLTAGKDITIESVVKNETTHAYRFHSMKEDALPFDFALALAVMNGNNRIDIKQGAQLNADGAIDISANTERSASLDAWGGNGQSYAALSIGILIEDFDTHVSIGGTLIAKTMDITAVTDVDSNSVTAVVSMGSTEWDDTAYTIAEAASDLPAFGIKKGVDALIKKIAGDSSRKAEEFGLGLGLALIVDKIDTTVTIAGTAKMTATETLNVEASTTNMPVVVASALIRKYEVGEDKKKEDVTKKAAVAMSLPVTVVLQNTSAVVEGGAIIQARKEVTIDAKTEVPYNTDQYFANLIKNIIYFSDSDNDRTGPKIAEFVYDSIGDLHNMLMSSTLGASGFFNSWSQTSVEADVLAIGGMVSVTYMDNKTVAKIQDGVTITGIGMNKPDVIVSAVTDTQMGHFVGNIHSFLDNVKTDPSMWGSNSAKGIGAAVIFDWIDNQSIAEIGAVQLINVNKVDVSAETKGFDLNFDIGASKSKDLGLLGNVGVTVFKAEARAKIAEGAQITAAGDVNIHAKDQTILLNVGGSAVTSSGVAFGLTAMVPIAIREVYAVWGYYPDEDVSSTGNIVESVVGGNVNIKTEALGVTATVAVAGAVTTEDKPAPGKKMSSPEDSLNYVYKAFEGAKSLSKSADLQAKVKEIQAQLTKPGSDSNGGNNSTDVGIAGAVAVNLLIEDIFAGINGHVVIKANSFDIEAVNNAIDAALVGGLVIQTGSGTNDGIAGALGVNMLFGDTIALVDTKNGALTYTDSFQLEANRGGYIGALTASAAGSTSSKGFEIAGSLSVASIKSETRANIQNTTITSTNGDLIVGATNEALIANIAGGLAIGGKAAGGVSIAASNLTLDTRVSIVDSVIHARHLATVATTESLIITIALAGGVTTGNVGVGGTLAFVLSDSDTSVSISGSTLNLSGDFIAVAWSDTMKGTDGTYKDLLTVLAETEQNFNDEDEKTDYFNDNESVTFKKTDENRNDTTKSKEIKFGLSAFSPRIITAALAVGGGGTVGVGANIGVNLMTEETFVSIAGSTITTRSADIQAKTEGGMIAVAVGVGAGKTAGVAGNVGVNLVGGRTEVVFDKSTLKATTGDIDVSAKSTAGITNVSLTVGAGGTAGVGAGFSYNMVAHSVAVDLYNKSTVDARTGNVHFVAKNNSDLNSILIAIGGGGTAGVGASLSINTIGTIQLDDADLETPQDTKDEKNKKDGELNSLFANVTGENNPLKVLWNARNRTEIFIVDSVVNADGNMTMDASSNGGLISISAAVGAAGTAGVGVGASYNSISGRVGVAAQNSTLTAGQNIIGSSQINNAMYSVVIGGGVGGTAGVGVSVGANVLVATNQISLSANSKINATHGDIAFKATNSGEVVGSSLALAGGQYAGVAAALTVNVLKGTTKVNVANTELIAGDSIVLDAEAVNDMYGVTGAFALTISITGSASIGATVAVNDLRSTANIDIVNSVLNAEGNVLIHSNVDGDLLAVTGNVAGSLVGASVAGSVTYNGVRSESIIDIRDTAINAKANKGRNFDDLARIYSLGKNSEISKTFENKKGIGIHAYSHGEIENYFFLVAASLIAGVSVGVPLNEIYGTTKVDLDRVNLNQTVSGAPSQNIIIEALAETRSIGVVASSSFGIAAVSAVTDIHKLGSVVETNISASNLKAARNISIGSRNSDNTDTVLVGVSIGGVAVPINAQGIIATTKVQTNLRSGETGNTMEAGHNLDVYAESLLDIFELNAAVAGGAVGVGVAFTINNLEQLTSINIGGKYNLISGNALSVRAKGETIFAEHIDALGAGAVGVGGAMGLLLVDSYTEIVFDHTGGTAHLQGNTIEVQAEDIFAQKSSHVGGFAVGAVGAAGGLNILELRNGVMISGIADMTATDSITVNATVTRTIDDLITIAGALGGIGLAGTLNHITIGGAKGSKEGTEDTLAALGNIDFSNTGTTRTDGLSEKINGVVDNLAIPVEKQSAALLLGGNLIAKDITLEAVAINNIHTTVAGIAAGLTAAGGALLYTNVDDHITASFTGNAVASQFTLQGQSFNKGHTEVIAGAGGIYGGAAAGNWTTMKSNIMTALGNNSVIHANAVNIGANQVFDGVIAKADSGAVGLVGVGGSHLELSLEGDAVVEIGYGAEIYAKNMTLEAAKNYWNSQTDAFGLSGGLIAGGGATSKLNLKGNANVNIRNSAILWNSETGFPTSNDKISINAVVNVNDVLSEGRVSTGSLTGGTHGDAYLNINFDTIIDIRGANMLSGIIGLNAFRNLTKASAQQTSDAYGFVTGAGGSSNVTLAGNNNIKLTNSTLEAWKTLSLSAGSGTTALDAQTRVYSGSIIPASSSVTTKATTTVEVNNLIELAGSELYSVQDIFLLTGQESYTTVAYAATQYMWTSSSLDSFIGDNEFSIIESSGDVKTTNSNTISLLGGNTLEAGTHWDMFITIDENGNIIKSPWIAQEQVQKIDVNMYDLLTSMIYSLQEKKWLSAEFPNETQAYQAEIDYLTDQLKYYLKNSLPSDPNAVDAFLANRDNYITTSIFQISGNISASGGNIVLMTGGSTSASNRLSAQATDVLTAHGDPQIAITNQSNSFLEIRDAILSIPNPLSGSGHIIVNRVAVDQIGNATLHASRGGSEPTISIANTASGIGGVAPEMFLVNSVLNNPGGRVELDSKGSIWIDKGSVLNARDISIATAGSFYLNDEYGRFDVGGNPFGSGSDIADAIRNWMDDVMLFGKNMTFSTSDVQGILDDLKAQFEAIARVEYSEANYHQRIAQFEIWIEENRVSLESFNTIFQELSTPESWEAAHIINDDGTKWLDPHLLEAREDQSVWLSREVAMYTRTYDGADNTIERLAQVTSLFEQISFYENNLGTITSTGITISDAFATYNDAIIALQSAVTLESWACVFGLNADPASQGDLSKLVLKSGDPLSTQDRMVTDYTESKWIYEAFLGMTTTAYLKEHITVFSDARDTSYDLDTPSGIAAKSQVEAASSKQEMTVAMTTPGSTIYGARSVFISAEILNINGTIHSGSLEYDIDLTTSTVQNAIAGASGPTDLTAAVLMDYHGNPYVMPKITYENGTIVIDDIVAMGGNITLSGNIISTGNGQLIVEDGYGNIKITAPETINLVLGRVDAGLGAEGTIMILDTSKTDTDGNPLKTIYTRKDGVYYMNDTIVNETDLTYATTEDRWLKNIVGTTTTLNWYYSYDRRVGYAFGIGTDGSAKDHNEVTGVRGFGTVDGRTPVGTFLVTDSTIGDGMLYGLYQRTTTSAKETLLKINDTGVPTWGVGTRHYYHDYMGTQSFTETFSTYLNASQPIAITFLGSDNAADGNVNILGGRTVTLGDLVRAVGTITIATNTGSIVESDPLSTPPVLTAKQIHLTAQTIGSEYRPIQLESVTDGTVVNINSTATHLSVSKGPLLVDTINGANINITSTHDVLMQTGGTGITASNDLKITVQNGRIAGENALDPFKINVLGNVRLSATGDIRIEQENDLHVDQIATGPGGDIYVNVTNGSILDSNTWSAMDPWADSQTRLADLWDSLGLIEGSSEYNAKIEQRIQAYENEFTQFYFDAWQSLWTETAGGYGNDGNWITGKYDMSKYDPNYKFVYSQEQRNIFLQSNWTEAQIAVEEAKRTDLYHSAFQSGINKDYRYVATQAERDVLTANSGWTKEQLENALAIPLFILTQDAGFRNNTTSLVEEPNFIGRNITLTANNKIGSEDTGIVIPVVTAKEFAANPEWVRAIADAEWDDIVFNPGGGITIKRYDDINIETSGWLKTYSHLGATYLGSQSDVVVNEIVSGASGTQPLILKIDGNIIPMIHDSLQAHIVALNAVLEAAGGAIGTATTPLCLYLTGGANGWITARGTEGVYLHFIDSLNQDANAYIREIGSTQGTVSIVAAALIDAQPELANAKIGGKDIVLIAMGDIGSAMTPLLISQMFGGSLSVTSVGNVFLTNKSDLLNIVELSIGGDANIVAHGNLALTNALLAIAGDTFLTATKGNLTISGCTAKLGNTHFSAGNDISVTDWLLTVLGTLDITAVGDVFMANTSITTLGDMNTSGRDISVANSNLASAGDINIIAGHNIVVTGSSLAAKNMSHVAGNDVSLMGSDIFVEGVYRITAANRLTIRNTAATFGDFVGNYRFADFDASWHRSTSGVDIVHDPLFWNSLAADRIVRQSALSFWSNIMRQYEVNSAGLIGGGWLSLDEEEEEEEEEATEEAEIESEGKETLDASDMPEQPGVPVAVHFVPRVSFSRMPDTTESIIALKSFST